MRLFLGLIKGLVIGSAVGFGAFKLGMHGGWNWIIYGVVGAMVGLLAGRPIWSHLADKNSTVIVAVLKGIVGAVIAVGLYALVAKVWGGIDGIAIAPLAGDETRNLYDWPFLLGGIIGGVYGAWVEIDDAPDRSAAPPERSLPPKS